MPHERFSTPETPKPKYAEDIFDRLTEIERGVEIPRASATRLTTGKDSEVRLSISERLAGEGWDLKALTQARPGAPLLHRSGEVFEVVEVKKERMRIKNRETGAIGEIVAQPRRMKAQEYVYELRDRSRTSKIIKVFDTVYKDRSLDTTEFIDEMVEAIPAFCREVFDDIEIHRLSSNKEGKFRAEPSLFSNRKVLALYVSEEGYPIERAIKILYHELGHAIARYLRGMVHPGEKWKRRMAADGNIVSEYASKTRYPKQDRGEPVDDGEIEDFADAVMLYLGADGAKTSVAKPLRDFCRNRFELLDAIVAEVSRRTNASLMEGLKSRLTRSSSPLDD